MKEVCIFNETRDSFLAQRACVADSFFPRLKGLLGKKCLPPQGGLVIIPCSSVHCMGMKFPIDVLYVSLEHKVLKVVENLRPNRLGPIVKGSKYVVELPAGTISATSTGEGDILHLKNINDD
ncbi:DUF192 domain-containing protein [Candidatus Contubernalis alkaliaceticus]|uniref:DUF192 domain-containing protein n=1 Tax=Candidatus Contubernalis alkaliaceticus TaxID=338645 RepID=UPI001F4C2879|nr:DUF192 domain-containing protein [Candidatus Contubernalis alkalaceticus]UNC92269.1 DUF192 domain-containing protein [Candidatus Contubernalis alkalaceticus]